LLNLIKISNIENSVLKIVNLIFLIFILLNFNRLYAHPYTLEWNFIELSNYFYGKNLFFDIEKYKIWQANTTFYSLIISIFYFITNDNLIIYARCLNIFILYLCIIQTFKNLNKNLLIPGILVLVLIIFNPIYNVYIFRIYPDILSICLFYLSLLFFWNKKTVNTYLFFSISTLIKPVVIIFSFIFLIKNFKDGKKFYENLAQVGLIILFSLLIYGMYVLFFEKTIFSNKVGSSYLNFNIYNSLNNFFRYFIYSFLLLGPLNLILFFKILNYKKNFDIIIVAAILTLVVFYFLKININYGELEFGFINSILGKKIWVLNIIILFMCNFYICFNIKNYNENSLIFFIFIFSLIILSFLIYRPAQRYIMYTYPLFIFYLIIFLEIKKININFLLICFTISFYLAVNFTQFYIQKQKTLIYDDIIKEIIDRNIIDETYPEILTGSHGFYFENFIRKVRNTEDKSSYKYIIISSKKCGDNNIISKKLKIFTYSYHICLTKK
jgi:hypothetical protein